MLLGFSGFGDLVLFFFLKRIFGSEEVEAEKCKLADFAEGVGQGALKW